MSFNNSNFINGKEKSYKELMEETNMQVLVMYYSRTGNTKKLAEEITGGIKEVSDVNCLLKPVDEVIEDDFISSDGIIAGSPVYFGTMAAEMKIVFDKFITIRKRMEDKFGAAFTTSHNPTGGKETTMLSIIQAFLIYGMIIVGDPMEAGGHYGVACEGAPDEQTALYGAQLGKRVALLVKKLRG